MVKINDYVYQLESEVVEYVRDQVYHESFTYYSDSEIKEFQENAVNSRICDLDEILDVDKVLKMNEKIKLENIEDLDNKLSENQKMTLIKHCNKYMIAPHICAWYDDMEDFYQDWITDSKIYKSEHQADERFLRGLESGEFLNFSDDQIVRLIL